jgi:hypothetical protein
MTLKRWGPFVALNFAVWLLMTAILVVVPDTLEAWLGLEIARVVGWAVACGVWVVAVESQWKARFGPLTRFICQLILWVGAAIVALWISELASGVSLSS